MSTNPAESDPPQWQTYPGLPNDPGQPPPQAQPNGGGPAARPPANSTPAGRPYADPQDDPAFHAYQDYARARPEMQPHQAPYQQRKDPERLLRDKWKWIFIAIAIMFGVMVLSRGDVPWVLIIMGLAIWSIFRSRRRRG